MTIDSKDSGGVNDVPGGNDENPENKTEKPSTVTREAYERAITEAKKAREKLAQIEAEAKKRQEEELQAQQKYKELYETEKANAETWKGKYTELDTDLSRMRKLNAFMGKLNGTVEREYWDKIDLEKISLDSDTGTIDEASVVRAVKEFETKHSRLIDRPTTTKLPNDAPKGGGTMLTYEEWLKLPYQEKVNRRKDVKDA